jgi:hypothetical protein
LPRCQLYNFGTGELLFLLHFLFLKNKNKAKTLSQFHFEIKHFAQKRFCGNFSLRRQMQFLNEKKMK